ncbi:hypothetical protein TorRG33x02_279030 [Trema orientale]|uniref:DUF4283 domain-containing protein n=1 Tax=Trema orientale TaxID=63057 RepID=A0A2P5CN91_TREOI|nr:hypothetical protein TorRG33x02_279030 [Trema orientale]
MSPKLDRYMTSYLLSGYAFNDFELKSNVNHGLFDDSDVDSLNPSIELVAAVDGLQQSNDLQGAHGLVEEPTRVANPFPRSAVGDIGMGGAAARFDTAGHSPRAAHRDDLFLEGRGAHGVERQGAHGLVNVRVSSNQLTGAHVPTRVPSPLTRSASARIGGLPRVIAPIASKSGYTIIDSLAKVASCDDVLAKTISKPASIMGHGVGPSFAQVLGNSTMHGPTAISAAMHVTNIAPESSKPLLKGNYVCVKVNETALQNRLEMCQFSLIGRIFLSKGDSPWKLVDLKFKLQIVWSLYSSWRFHILLSSEADKAKVWGLGSLNLKPGVLRLQPWFPNFNPHTQSSTNA